MMERLSERVGGTGSLQAEGIANILGRPPFDKLTLVLREAAQNIWDARLRKEGASAPRMLVRLRTLAPAQQEALKACLAGGSAGEREPAHLDELAQHLARSGPIQVLEIADFNTVGLHGGIDPRNSSSNFVRFFFDIGAAHFQDGDGGTYGYGRSSLYLMSAVRTILVDSVPYDEPAGRRVMACRIGNSYTARRMAGEPSRFTGRHFWGRRMDDSSIHPVIGDPATMIADSLGLPHRAEGESGTTIMIPWPELEGQPPGEAIVKAVRDNLWPKMVSRGGRRPMRFEVDIEGRSLPIPDPSSHPTYSLFSEALLSARSRASGMGALPILRYSTELGHMGFASRLRSADGSVGEAGHDRFRNGVHHVALMRPSELVVRYLEFPGLDDTRDWAGVFLCSEEDEIRNAFAQSEPPAHDDWVPDRLDGNDRLIVQFALRSIRSHVRTRFAAQVPVASAPLTTSLGGAADRFANQFLSGDGSAPRLGDGKAPRPRPRPAMVVPTPVFVGLEHVGGRSLARFRVRFPGPDPTRVKGVASVVIQGGGELPEGLREPVVTGWRCPDGSLVAGDGCLLKTPGDYHVEIEFKDRYALEFRLQRTAR